MKKYLLIAGILCAITGAGQTITLSGQIGEQTDSIIVLVWDHFFSNARKMTTPFRSFRVSSQSGTFTIQLDSINDPVYFSLYSINKTRNIPKEELILYLAEPGDNIRLDIGSKKELQISGKGSAKYIFQYRLDTLTDYWNNRRYYDHAKYADFKNKNYQDFERKTFNELDSLLNRQLQLLEEYKTQLSGKVWLQLQADILGKIMENKYECFRLLERDIRLQNIASQGQNNLTQLYNLLKVSTNNTCIEIPDSSLAMSKYYPRGMLQMIMAAERQTQRSAIDKRIEENFNGILRDKIWAIYLIDNFDYMTDADSILAMAVEKIATPHYKVPLQMMQNRLTRGAPAYNFVLEDTKGKYRSLSEFKGKNVFLDFWYTGCTGCVQLYKNALADIEEIFSKDTSMAFITISIDTDKETWLNSIAEGNYTSAKAINLRTGSMGNNHPVINRYGVSAFPKTFLLDKNGIIYSNTQTIREKDKLLSLLQEVSKH